MKLHISQRTAINMMQTLASFHTHQMVVVLRQRVVDEMLSKCDQGAGPRSDLQLTVTSRSGKQVKARPSAKDAPFGYIVHSIL